MVTEARGIDHLLPAGHETPSPIRSSHMDVFFEQVVRGDFVEHPDDAPQLWFKKDEKVFVTSGPFTGHVGRFVRANRGAFVLKITFFGTELEAMFKGHQVSKAV